MSDPIERKSVVSISDMARMVGLSRGRFYQLIGTAFPSPLYDEKTGRPYYTEELQQICLDVKRQNCGIDGRPILFYARRTTITAAKPSHSRKKTSGIKVADHADLIEGLRSLGMLAGHAQVEAAVKAAYPSGTDGVAQGEVLRAVFLHLRAQG